MTASAQGPCFADQAHFAVAEVTTLRQTAKDTYLLRLRAPSVAQAIAPGQFVMIRLAGLTDVLLGRPLALYETHDGPRTPREYVDVVFVAKGRFTSRARQLQPGAQVEIWGPLGNAFPSISVEHLLLVAGGIGHTPFLAVARERLGRRSYGPADRVVPTAKRVTLCYGARTSHYFSGVDDFNSAGVDVRLATDDGSIGHQGLVTDLVQVALNQTDRPDLIFVCGPEPMMDAVASVAQSAEVPCYVSLETPMACGIGICFTCVAKIRDDRSDDWDYRRTCIEGPIFESTRVVW